VEPNIRSYARPAHTYTVTLYRHSTNLLICEQVQALNHTDACKQAKQLERKFRMKVESVVYTPPPSVPLSTFYGYIPYPNTFENSLTR
jgi:hypothetical protein